MPIIRSPYTIQQFENILQKKACQLVSKETGIRCEAQQGKFIRVKTEDWELRFSYGANGACRRISVHYAKFTGKIRCYDCGKTFMEKDWKSHIDEVHEGNDWYGYRETEGWSFTVEPKLYFSSNHMTKIDASDADEVQKWIAQTMAKYNIKPVPRFELKMVKDES